MRSRGILVVIDRKGKRIFPVRGDEISIGRSIDNTVTIADEKSSRRHCFIRPAEEEVLLVDNKSLNGTILNGRLVTEGDLRFGDKIVIGATEIFYEEEQEGLIDTKSRPSVRVDEEIDYDDTRHELTDTQIHRDRGTRVAHSELDNLRLENRILMEILEISARLNTELEPVHLLEDIVDTAIRLTGAERGFLAMVDGEEISIEISRDLEEGDIDNPSELVSASILNRCINSGRTVVLSDAVGDEYFGEVKSVRDLALRSVLCVPLRHKTKVFGAIYIDNQYDENVFRQGEVRLVEAFCAQASVAIQNAKLVTELRHSREEVEKLNRELEERFERQSAELVSVREYLRSGLDEVEFKYNYDNIIGQSPKMKEIFRILDKVTDRDMEVLIEGESGTGKELVARAIHFNSRRRKMPFISENCAAIPDSILEAELFGAVEGAYTGARNKIGLVEAADGGTLFLDEIGEMSLDAQKSLLRVLQESEVRPVGSTARPRKVDFRLITATNRNLAEAVRAGEFREDLYYRVNTITIRMPPLRERREDVPLLVDFVLNEVARRNDEPKMRIDKAALTALCGYPWPGNVRQLRSEVARAALMCGEDGVITLDALTPELLEDRGPSHLSDLSEGRTLKEITEDVERRIIAEVLEYTRGNKTKAAEILGLSRLGLRKKMDRYEIG